jgi:hypothetical protein
VTKHKNEVVLIKGRYSKISRHMWNDEKVRRLTPPAPCGFNLFQRFLCGPELTNVPGLFTAWEAGMAQALKWDLEAFREAYAEVFREGLAEADWEAGLVWVPKAIEHNPPESANVVMSWAATISELPDCDLKTRALLSLQSRMNERGKPWAEAFAKAIGKPLPKPSGKATVKPKGNQEQEQEQEQEQKEESLPFSPEPPKQPREDPFMASLTGSLPGQLPEVREIHRVWRETFGKTGATIGNPNGEFAKMIRDAARDYGLDDCLAVIRYAPNDGMVNGKDDEKGKPHDDLFYILNNKRTFDRLLVAAKAEAAPKPRKPSIVEQIAAQKAL